MGPLAKKLLQEKYKDPKKVRKMKAAELVVSFTSGILGVIASWQNADGQVLRPQYARFVGEFSVVVRELTAPSIHPEEMNKLQSRVMKLRDEMERNNSPEALVIMSHLLVHIVDQLKDNGPAREIWMYVFEDYFGLLKLSIKTRSQPVASMMKGLELRRTVSTVSGIKRMMHRSGRAPHYRPPAKQNIFTTKSSTVRPTADDSENIQVYLRTEFPEYDTLCKKFDDRLDSFNRHVEKVPKNFADSAFHRGGADLRLEIPY
ncbi:hypothetical protein CYMTET_5766 [Cymbomonas tetramitiformis]|uniref:DUF4218 domain-containing protein n=1 Tax=Cymbomonas tetramitiformis TaxID=36881 RepID=A0AAE0GYV7_9CHLO|nr:hypothetical protein CYMTET_5766 [Cymbomonas tetramitiformis]